MKKIIGTITLLNVCLFAVAPWGSAAEDAILRKNAIAIKLGAQFFSGSGFTDFWGIDDGSLIGTVFEIDYDRKIIDYLFVDVTAGFATADEKSRNIRFDNAATAEVALNNLYLSPTVKALAPLNKSVNLYGGIGLDLSYSEYEIDIAVNTAETRITDNAFSFGGHALLGLEWLFYKKPVRHGQLDAPMGLIFEYKFAYVPIDNYDQEAIDVVNAGLGTNYSANDFDAGGHFISIGLKWHF